MLLVVSISGLSRDTCWKNHCRPVAIMRWVFKAAPAGNAPDKTGHGWGKKPSVKKYWKISISYSVLFA
jgi:hypothetical protein